MSDWLISTDKNIKSIDALFDEGYFKNFMSLRISGFHRIPGVDNEKYVSEFVENELDMLLLLKKYGLIYMNSRFPNNFFYEPTEDGRWKIASFHHGLKVLFVKKKTSSKSRKKIEVEGEKGMDEYQNIKGRKNSESWG